MGLFDGKAGRHFRHRERVFDRLSHHPAAPRAGAELAFTHLPDKDPARPKNANKVRKLVEGMKTKFLMPCDITEGRARSTPSSPRPRKSSARSTSSLHSIAFAPPADLVGPVYACSREGFKLAMEISAYSMIALTGRAKDR